MSLRFAALFLAASGVFAVACSSPTPDPQPMVSIDALTNTGSSSSGTRAVGAAGDCVSTTTQSSCIACVAAAHSAGASAYVVILRDAFCAPDVCHADCAATYCATPQKSLDTACFTCASAAEPAVAQTVSTACSADAECEAFNRGLTEAQCATKPQ